jgi:uncharacterized protein YggE
MRGLIASLVIGLAASFSAEPAETLSITGNATVSVKPDTARIHYSVRSTDSSVEAAHDSVTKQVTGLSDSIKGLKLENLSTLTGSIAYSKNSSRRAPAFNPGANPAGGPGASLYQAMVPMTATITNKDPDKLRTNVDLFVKKAVEAGATMPGDDSDSPFTTARGLLNSEGPRVDWLLADDSAARRDAFRNALRKAKADAETLAKELGWEKITLLSVSDGNSTSTGDRLDSALSSNLRISSGEVSVTVRVTLKYSR